MARDSFAVYCARDGMMPKFVTRTETCRAIGILLEDRSTQAVQDGATKFPTLKSEA